MGSEISDQTKKSEDHDKRLASLEAAKVTGTQIPENVDSQTLRQQLGDLQKIVEVEMGNHTQEITLLSTQISQLENLLKSPSGQPVVEVSSAQSSFKEQLSTLTEKVNSAFENFTKTYPPGSIVDKGEFLAFKEDTLSNVQKTNQTLFTLSDEFDALAVRLTTVDDAIINITSVLNTIKKGDDKGTNSSAPEPAVTTAQTEVTESKILHSDNIKDVNELNKLMEELSSNGQPVDLMELKKHGIDGDNEAFVLADTNSDQKYSKEELVQALKLPDGSMR
ncbi:unnamed protein product [Lymnaea stagnalis]|uniref:EF-hand domain-containing protein n=1 Tax=Lymnaea stagnalis TaxID=6523 RepID=A0AAV2HB48_LYMST